MEKLFKVDFSNSKIKGASIENFDDATIDNEVQKIKALPGNIPVSYTHLDVYKRQGIGEIVGGSQREERLEKLEARMAEMHIPSEEMSWYLDTRRFGTVPHAGFGLGFERMVQFVTGMTNIRDVIAFARTPKNCEF